MVDKVPSGVPTPAQQSSRAGGNIIVQKLKKPATRTAAGAKRGAIAPKSGGRGRR